MDVILDLADEYVFNRVYSSLPALPLPDLTAAIAALPSWSECLSFANSSSSSSSPSPIAAIAQNVYSALWASNLSLHSLPTDNIFRQTLSLYVLTYLGALIMYFAFATPSYFLVFDQNHKKHPKYLKNQIKLEIMMSMKALPNIAVMTVPWLLGEVRGWSQLYSHIHRKDNIFGPLAPLVEPFLDGWGYVAVSIIGFLLFTDMGIYWVHRWLHHPLLYKRLHKPHHKWIIPTPFSSHAFHPVDGYMQSVPYHLFVFLVPMQKYIYLVMFSLVNLWSVLIHDGEYLVNSAVINSAAHHAVHHLYFNYNYGQYSTLWDRIGGSYRTPDAALYDPTLRMDKAVWKKQAKDVDAFDDNGKPTAASDRTFTTGTKMKVL
ncbi:MAG: sterol delta 5,6-desaturase ERG3 [Benniella sp.]|nr:MAG: sterol delta 5,6-desaturase ERG3 [Benniella sp.]